MFNQYEYTRACLQTVSGLAYPNRETIVVDNASTDSTPLLLPREFPWVRIERNEANLGFAGGCNVGIPPTRVPTGTQPAAIASASALPNAS